MARKSLTYQEQMDKIDRRHIANHKRRLRDDPTWVEYFIERVQSPDQGLYEGTHNSEFRAIEELLGVEEGDIDFESVNSKDVLEQLERSLK